MGLLPKKEITKPQGPAVELRERYRKATGSKVPVAVRDFVRLLRMAPLEEIETVIDWLKNQPSSIRHRPSSWFAYRYRWLANMAKEDMAGYPIRDLQNIEEVQEAMQRQSVEPIGAAYIQHCADEFTAFCRHLLETEDGVYVSNYLLPPVWTFVRNWFVDMVPGYSVKYRKFSIKHPMFRKYFLATVGPLTSRTAATKLLDSYNASA